MSGHRGAVWSGAIGAVQPASGADVPVLVTPATVSLEITTYVPTVTTTVPVVVTPTTASLEITTYPLAEVTAVVPATTGLEITTYAPTVFETVLDEVADLHVLQKDFALQIAPGGEGPDAVESSVELDTSNNELRVWADGSPFLLVDGTRDCTGAMSIAADTDASVDIGRLRINSVVSDWLYLGHVDQAGSSTYALRHTSMGALGLNAATGQNLQLLYANVAKVNVGSGGVQIAAAAGAAASLLHVSCAGDASALRVDDTLGNSGFGLAPNSNAKVIIRDTGTQARFEYDGSNYLKVSVSAAGIGVLEGVGTTPYVQIRNDGGTVDGLLQHLNIRDGTSMAAGVGGAFVLMGETGAGVDSFAGVKGSKQNATSGQTGGHLDLYSRDDGADLQNNLRLTSDGNVELRVGAADLSNKVSNVSCASYDNSDGQVMGIRLDQRVSANTLYIGGGSSSYVAQQHIRFYAAASVGDTIGNHKMWVATQGVRIGDAGGSVGDLFHVYATGNSDALRVDDTLGVTGIGGVPVSTVALSVYSTDKAQRWYYDGSNYGTLSVTSSGDVTLFGTGTGPSVKIGTTNGQLLCNPTGTRIQLGALGNPSDLLHVAAAGDSNAFRIDDTTAHVGIGTYPSSGWHVHIDAGASHALFVDSTSGDQLRLRYDSSNYTGFAVVSTGLMTMIANGSSPAYRVKVGASDMLRVDSTGLRVSTTWAVANDLFDVSCAGDADAFRIDDTLGNSAFGTTPWSGVKLRIQNTSTQLRVQYDASNYVSYSVGATGNLTITSTGTGPYVQFKGPGGSYSGVQTHLSVRDTTSVAAGVGGAINFAGDTAATALAAIGAYKENATSGQTGGHLDLYSRANGSNLALVARGAADGKFLCQGALGVGNTATASTPGTVTDKMEVFDASGASVGFVAIYDSIT